MMKLSAHAIFCLSEAMHKLNEAAADSEEPAKSQILELHDEVKAVKEWGEE